MSQPETRQALVDALSKLPQLAVSSTQPDTLTAGSAWPAWSSLSWLNACATTSEWFVFVCVPNGSLQSTTDAADLLLEDVATVLWPIGKVTRVEPWRLPLEPGQQAVPVLRFTMEI